MPDDSDFASNLREVQSRLYGYIHSLVRDLNDADDLFQQTAMILWRKSAEFDGSRSFAAWAFGIARFEVINFLRTRGRRRLYFSDELNLLLIEENVEFSNEELLERKEALAKCLAKLRERDQELLLECYEEHSGVNDAAERRGRSSQSVYNSLRRIRRAVHECISRILPDEPNPAWETRPQCP